MFRIFAAEKTVERSTRKASIHPNPDSAGRAMRGLNQGLRKAALAAALCLMPLQALAVPVDVFFNGATFPGQGITQFGMSEADAFAARDNFGIDIITNATIDFTAGNVGITQPPSVDFSPNPPINPTRNTAISNWTVENTSGAALTGASYLLFTHSDPFTLLGTPVDYPDPNIGIAIDADTGWSIVASETGGTTYYYAALLLDRTAATPLEGMLAPGASVGAEINYVVSQALIEVGGLGSNAFALPEYELLFANVPVPEPGTALLMGLGLVALASNRRNS